MTFHDSKARQIDIVFDGDSEVVAWDGLVRIGTISFDYRCGDDEIGEDPHLYITHLDILPLYCKAGIGTKMLEHVKNETNLPILAADNDGIKRDDGSHLTGDGPNFIAAMRRKRLVVSSSRYFDEY